MSIRETLNVSLTVEPGKYISRQVKAGLYRSARELVRAALREQQDRDEDLNISKPAVAQTN